MITRLNENTTDPDFNEELLLVQLEIQEHGLEMIRREIYENVGQVLSLVKLYLSDYFPSKKTQLVQSISHSRELLGKAITDLRSIAKPVDLKEIQEKGIIEAIRHELETLSRIHPAMHSFTVNGNFFRFDLTKELFAFRIIQEIMSACMNIDISRRFTLQVDYQPEEVIFLMMCGTSSATADLDQFLPNARRMQQRAGLIDAVLSFYEKPDGELTALLRLPVNRLMSTT